MSSPNYMFSNVMTAITDSFPNSFDCQFSTSKP